MRRAFLGAVARWMAAAAVAGAMTGANAQAFPSRPIIVVVPFGPGGAPDTVLKVLEPHLQKKLGRPVLLEFRPGAGTMVASRYVADAPPDGHTLLLTGLSSVLAPEVNPAAGGRNHTKDMVYVAPMAIIPNFIYASAELPVRTLPELVAYAKANPGKLSYATPGIGTGPHLQMELFKKAVGVDLLHVPYKGTDAMLSDLVAGRTHVTLLDYPSSKAFVESGKMRVLATTLAQRIRPLPNVPTLAESGAAVTVVPWIGISAPKGTPPQVVSILHEAFKEALAQPDAQERLRAFFLEPMAMSPQEFQQFVERDIDRWSRFVKDAGIKVQ